MVVNTIVLVCSSLVPKCDIKALNGLPPKPITKTKHWNQAMFELKRYGENIESMRDKLGPGGVKDKSLKLLMMKSKVTRPLNSGGGLMQNSLSQQKEPGKDHAQSHSQFPPPVVEVTPSSDGPDGMGSLSDTEVSSPGTPPSLQIDLKDSGHNSSPSSSQERTPSKGRAMPSGGRSLIGGISRNSQVPGSLDFNSDSGAQSVVVRSPSANTSSKMMKRKGAALSALVSSLAQRKRVAEQVGALTPVHQGAAIRGEGMPGGGLQEEAEAGGKGKGVAAAAAASAEEAPGKTNSPFSSMYVQSCKTAFAIVDPDQKRTKRKTTKAIGSESLAPPAKKARGNNTANAADSNKVDNGDLSDPAAFAARVQEFSNAAISALNTTTATSSHPVSNLKASNTAVATGNSRATTSVSPQNTSGSSNSSGTSATTLALPGLPKSRSTGGKKKKRTPADRNRGKSPQKGVVRANTTATSTATAAAAVTTPAAVSSSSVLPANLPSALAALISASTSSSAPSGGSTTTSTASSSRANFMNMVAHPQGVVSSRETPSGGGSGTNGEVRGEIAAPGITSEEINDFAEGTGLLADTIRIVNSSFLARVNQMTGPSDDMGYKYFVEKVSRLINLSIHASSFVNYFSLWLL